MPRTLTLLYGDREFQFEPSWKASLRGRLVLSTEQRRILRLLVEAEAEDWYLDQNGERLPEEALFDKSPWSVLADNGQSMKVLARLLNIETGESMFSAPSTYDGELFEWLRSRRPGA